MIRARALVATVLLAGLTTPLTATAAPATSDAAPTAPAGRAQPAAPPTAPVMRKFVAYGDKAVRVPKGSRLVLSFEGRRGDLVTAGWDARLSFRGRAVPEAWESSDLFRLPSDGRFVFRVPRDRFGPQVVALVKARVHDLTIDGPALRTPKERRGYIDLAAFRLRRGDRVTVDSGRDEQRVYQRNADYCIGYGGPLLLRPGHHVRVNNDTVAVCDEAATGRTLVRVLSGHRVTVASALEVTVQPDGAPVTISAERKATRELVLTFDGTADDLVYLDEMDGLRITNGRSTLNRWEAARLGLLTGGDRREGFVVASTGPTELSTVTDAVGGDRTANVRLRKAIRVPDLVTDGPAVDVVLDGSGTRLYALATGKGQRLESSTRDLGADEGWTVEVGPRSPSACGQEPGGANGCADNAFLALSSAVPAATAAMFLRAPVAVAFGAPGATGTVSLRLVSTTP